MVLQVGQQGRPLHIAREPDACSSATVNKAFSPRVNTACDKMHDTAEQVVQSSSNKSPAKLGRVPSAGKKDPRTKTIRDDLDTRGGG